MGPENDILDTPTARQTTITLANAACQASTTTRHGVSADAVRMINLLNSKVLTDYVGGNLLVLAVRGEIDLGIYRSIAELQLGIPLLILFYICKSVLVNLYQFKYIIHQIEELFKVPVSGTVGMPPAGGRCPRAAQNIYNPRVTGTYLLKMACGYINAIEIRRRRTKVFSHSYFGMGLGSICILAWLMQSIIALTRLSSPISSPTIIQSNTSAIPAFKGLSKRPQIAT